MISSIFGPNISVKDIIVDNEPTGSREANQKSWGYNPLLWYNGIVINENLITYFELDTTSFLPVLNLVFKDESYIMGNQAFSLDNTIVSLYIDSRTKDSGGSNTLRPIRMDFKIIDYGFNDLSKDFHIKGIPDVDALYLQKIKSYHDQTSFQVMKKLAEETSLGFVTNIQSTDDKMNWINPSMENLYFMNYVTKNAYKNDQSFLVSYIDYYYNINFIDVEKQMLENIDEHIGAIQTGTIPKIEGSDNSLSVAPLYLTNNTKRGFSNNLITSFDVLNSSTRTSIKTGYRTNLHYYDRTGNWDQKAGSFLKFVIETNTDGRGISLKSTPSDINDTGFYKQNTKNIYLSPIDIDNTHMHYNYAQLLNDYNNKEIEKLKIKFVLAVPNFNFYKYQKIKVFLFDTLFGSDKLNINERLSGGWLIIGIKFNYSNSTGLVQELICVKRELSAGDIDF